MIVIVFVIAILEKLLDLRSACADVLFFYSKKHICPGFIAPVEKPGQKAVANRDYCGVLL